MLRPVIVAAVLLLHVADGTEQPPLVHQVGPGNDLSGLMPENPGYIVSGTSCFAIEHRTEYLRGQEIGLTRAHMGKREWIPILEETADGKPFVPPAGFRTILLEGQRMTPQLRAEIQGFNAGMLHTHYVNVFRARREKEAGEKKATGK
ncbi:hypothetical protein OVA24_16350 [Luteolibacter sp. SL250]|uniref:hypothetical protein n=1 Tax=Luteolibacter sp. SL250 TaxID=2995170 RepID=UPI002270F0A9|nr:hypothetical protein [Luteolibacter sp. SL250]WAC18802.1 hypothetical protein OVA24_16350 [Luteolibacter sp. SL250]